MAMAGKWLTTTALAALAAVGMAQAKQEGFRKPVLSIPSGKLTELIPGRIMIKFRESQATSIQNDAAARAIIAEGLVGGEYKGRLGTSGWTVWTVGTSGDPWRLCSELMRNPQVVYAEPVKRVYPMLSTPNDPDFTFMEDDPDLIFAIEGDPVPFKRDWHLDDTAAFLGWSVWPNTWYTSANKPQTCPTIAVIDTGCDLGHPDFINAGGASSDYHQGGQIDRANSVQFTFGEPDPNGTAEDFHGHGTHVTGLAVGSGNNGSYVGKGTIGTGYGAKAMVLRVFDSGGVGSDADAAGAIYYAADHGADVINLSLGTEAYSQAFEDACTYAFQKGCLVVAAGNEDGAGGGDLGPIYPAACSNVIGVSANGPGLVPAVQLYSGFGYYVDIAAPGGDMPFDGNQYTVQFVWSLAMRTPGVLYDMTQTGALFPPYLVDYAYLAGTSMATPQVSGAAAHYMGRFGLRQGNWSNYRTLRALEYSAYGVMGAPYGSREDYQGFGCLHMQALTMDAAARSFTAGSIEGKVYGGAVATANVPVRAKRLSNGFIYSTTSRLDGSYKFDAVPAGLYEVYIPPIAGGTTITKYRVNVRNGCECPGVDIWADGTFNWDETAPVAPKLLVTSSTANTVVGQHWAYDVETGIKKMVMKIGTSPGGSNVMPETEVFVGGDTTTNDPGSYRFTGLTLSKKTRYYLTAVYTNGANMTTTKMVAFSGASGILPR